MGCCVSIVEVICVVVDFVFKWFIGVFIDWVGCFFVVSIGFIRFGEIF